MDKGAGGKENEEGIEATFLMEKVVNNSHSEMTEEKKAKAEGVDARENAGDNGGGTKPKTKRKRRKKNKNKTLSEDSVAVASADSTCDAMELNCDGTTFCDSTEVLDNCADKSTTAESEGIKSQELIESKNSRRSRRRRRRRNKSRSDAGDCVTSQVQESVRCGNCDEGEEKARDDNSPIATSGIFSCDAITRNFDGTTCDDSSARLDECAGKLKPVNHTNVNANQNQKDGKESRRSKERNRENSQSSEATSEETSCFKGNMVKEEILKESLSVNDDKETQPRLETVEHVGSGKKKRNRQRKRNQAPERTGFEGKGSASDESFPRTPRDERRQNDHIGSKSGELKTLSANHKTPKSHNRSTRRDSFTETPRNRAKKQKPLYEKYWSSEEVSEGLKRRQLVKGVLRISQRNYEFAWVTVPNLKRDVLLEGMLKRNRALNGDIVALEILPKEGWKVMTEELHYNGITPGLKDNNIQDTTKCMEAMSLSPERDTQSALAATPHNSTGSSHKDDPIDVSQVPEQFLQRTAKVVHILEKKHTRVATGHLKPFPHPKDFPDGCFSPSDSRLPRIRIPREKCPPGFFERPRDFQTSLLVARIVSWPETSARDSFFAIGAIARSLGEAGEIEPETEGILLEYGIDSGPFSDEVLACLPQESPWKIPHEELENRRDFRGDSVFTIDPATARDLDDAIHCKTIKDNVFEVGVHIADVSYFVRQGTALDEAALEKGTSTYMVQKVVPMLPRRLCEELCSLNPGEDRLTFSIVWQMTEKGEILSDWKGRGIIRSRIKLSYDHAQDMIEKPKTEWNSDELPPIFDGATMQDISAQVNQLHKIALHLRRNRFEHGALRLDQVKIRFDLDQETGLPNGYHVYKQRDSNRLIEELMLLANMAVAHHIYNSYPEKALLRRHPKPHQKQLEDLLQLCKSFGICFNATSSKTIQESLAQFPLSSPEREALVNLAMRPMKNAEYFCTGSVEEDQFGHYALSVPLYTHFTSPIRRYPDLVVHRILAASLGIDEPLKQEPDIVDMIAEHCNDRKVAAKRAGELSDEMFFGIFVRESGSIEEDGVVLNVMDQSLDVLVPKLGVVKRVYLKFCPGLKNFGFTKGEKGKPAELSLLWSVKLKLGDVMYEEEHVLKTFHKVRVILSTESETETKSANPFKVMAKIVPKLKCEYYIPSSPATEKSLKKKKAAGNISDAGLPNPHEVRKKLFDSDFQNKARSSDVTFVFNGGNGVSAELKTKETASSDSDDVIVESEEDMTNLSNAINETTTTADDESDDVIVESDSEPEKVEDTI